MKSNIFLIFIALMFFVACTEDADPKVYFETGRYEKALPLWKMRAEQNDLEAQNFLGIHYMLGLGIKRDFSLARKWFLKAAEQGFPDAQRNLGLMYESGYGSERDFEKAFIWFYAAHRQGHPRAGASLEALAGLTKLTPNNQIVLKREARQYIFNEVLGVEDRDY